MPRTEMKDITLKQAVVRTAGATGAKTMTMNKINQKKREANKKDKKVPHKIENCSKFYGCIRIR